MLDSQEKYIYLPIKNSGCKLDQSYPLAMKHWSQAAESSQAGLGENEERLGVLQQRFAALVAGWGNNNGTGGHCIAV